MKAVSGLGFNGGFYRNHGKEHRNIEATTLLQGTMRVAARLLSDVYRQHV